MKKRNGLLVILALPLLFGAMCAAWKYENSWATLLFWGVLILQAVVALLWGRSGSFRAFALSKAAGLNLNLVGVLLLGHFAPANAAGIAFNVYFKPFLSWQFCLLVFLGTLLLESLLFYLAKNIKK